ncbi:MAG: DCL family protein [Fimbriimonadaceae bacterium]|nr:DCL family protein [Alphaproteobacteria bacterium]
MAKPVTINGTKFPTKLAAEAECRRMLKGKAGSKVTGRSAEFVEALWYARPDKIALLKGRKIIYFIRHFEREKNFGTMCFHAVLDDGEKIDFSYFKSVDELAKTS